MERIDVGKGAALIILSKEEVASINAGAKMTLELAAKADKILKGKGGQTLPQSLVNSSQRKV